MQFFMQKYTLKMLIILFQLRRKSFSRFPSKKSLVTLTARWGKRITQFCIPNVASEFLCFFHLIIILFCRNSSVIKFKVFPRDERKVPKWFNNNGAWLFTKDTLSWIIFNQKSFRSEIKFSKLTNLFA